MDNLFKALLIIILLAFLYLYYENSNNDRYSFSSFGAFDKRTGTYYTVEKNAFVSIDFINGTQNTINEYKY